MATFAELVAARLSGEMTNLDYCRAARAEHRAQHRASGHYRRELETLRNLRQRRESARRYADKLSDAYLTESLTGTRGDVDARYARILLQLPTADARADAWSGARRFLNATPDAGRPSDALASVVRSMLAGYPA